jgi:hypothetical protein
MHLILDLHLRTVAQRMRTVTQRMKLMEAPSHFHWQGLISMKDTSVISTFIRLELQLLGNNRGPNER